MKHASLNRVSFPVKGGKTWRDMLRELEKRAKNKFEEVCCLFFWTHTHCVHARLTILSFFRTGHSF